MLHFHEKKIQLIRKEGRFSRNLLKGLLFSLLFHLLFLCIFRVVSPSPIEVGSILPSLAVEVDLGTPPSQVDVKPSFVFSQSSVPPLILPSSICSIEGYREYSCKEPDFSSIEVFEYTPLEIDFDQD